MKAVEYRLASDGKECEEIFALWSQEFADDNVYEKVSASKKISIGSKNLFNVYLYIPYHKLISSIILCSIRTNTLLFSYQFNDPY